jgi:hypothetical protein
MNLEKQMICALLFEFENAVHKAYVSAVSFELLAKSRHQPIEHPVFSHLHLIPFRNVQPITDKNKFNFNYDYNH